MQRQPARHPGVVHHRPGGGEPLHEQHLLAVEDAELGVVADDGVQVLQVRQGRVAQGQGGRGPQRELPQPHPHPDRARRGALEQAEPDELLHQARRGGHVQARAAGDLRDTQLAAIAAERLQDAHDA